MSTESSSFKCPRCLHEVKAQRDQAGSRVACQHCSANLVVPENLAYGNLFDDLFVDDASGPKSMAAPVDLQTKVSSNPPIESTPPVGTPGDSQLDDLEFCPEQLIDCGESNCQAKQAELPLGEHDPFAYDATKAIRVEGLTPEIFLPTSFYFRCPVCHSNLQATERQIGEAIQCTDCHSKVNVQKPKPKREPDPWTRPARVVSGKQQDDELSLQASAKRAQHEHRIDPEFGLAEVTDDLLAPRDEPNSPQRTPSPKRSSSRNEKTSDSPQTRITRSPTKTTGQVTTVAGDATANSGNEPTKTICWKQLTGLQLLNDLDLVIRSLVATVFLSFAFALAKNVWATLQKEDLNAGEKFTEYFLSALAAPIFLMIALWLVAVNMSVLMRSIANGEKKVNEWVGFSPSEWFGSLLFVAFSGWAASVPGGLFGFVLSKLTGFWVLFPLFTALSVFVLFPYFLISAFFNESLFNIFSAATTRSLSSETACWGSLFRWNSACLGLVVAGVLLLFLPGMIFGLFAAALIVIAATSMACLIGIHAQNLSVRINAG